MSPYKRAGKSLKLQGLNSLRASFILKGVYESRQRSSRLQAPDNQYRVLSLNVHTYNGTRTSPRAIMTKL
jgi:hypothetical protein